MYPPLALGKLDSYLDSAARILRLSGAKLLITTKQVAPILWSLVAKVDGLRDLLLTETIREQEAPATVEALDKLDIKPEDPCFLQFTSGSTSEPKGVIVTHGNLAANAHAIMIDGLNSDPEVDRGVSWLPLYHDMGLIGFVVAPVITRVPVVFIPTLAFVKRPHIWMETIDKYRGTITFAPNFAMGLASKRATDARLAKLDLSCLRVVGCGAEPINAKTMRTFIDTFGEGRPQPQLVDARVRHGGSDPGDHVRFASAPLYRPAHRPRGLRDRPSGHAPRRVGRCERPGARLLWSHLPGARGRGGRRTGPTAARRPRGRDRRPRPKRQRRLLREPEATEQLLRGGWLHTGDLGFKHAGELYVSGRMKDLIILNGRNYYPQAIEWEVEQVEGVRKGNVVAFSVPGETTEELIIAAETKAEDLDALGRAIHGHLKTTIGIRTRDVKLVGPDSYRRLRAASSSGARPSRCTNCRRWAAMATAPWGRRPRESRSPSTSPTGPWFAFSAASRTRLEKSSSQRDGPEGRS